MYRISVRPIKAPFLSTQGLANSLSVFSDEERMHFCTRADRIYLLTPTRVYTAFGGDEALVDPSLSHQRTQFLKLLSKINKSIDRRIRTLLASDRF